MAIHTYHCDKCNATFERMEAMSAPDVTTCDCGGEARRVVQAPAVLYRWQRGEGADWAGKE